MAEGVGLQKAEVRERVLARRDAMSARVRATKSRKICERLEEAVRPLLKGKAPSPTVALFAPMGSEVDVMPFALWANEHGMRTAFPSMERATNLDNESRAKTVMRFRIVPASMLAHGSQPQFMAKPMRANDPHELDRQGFASVPANAIGMVVVPMVAFDDAGMRLGYGGGNYDRFLPQLSHGTLVVGVAFEEQRLSRVPQEPHDVPLPHIIST